MSALIVFDLQGGDAAYHLVDDALWKQIAKVYADCPDGSKEQTMDHLYEVVGWLTSEDTGEVTRPKFAPETRNGSIINTWHTQTFVIEPVNIKDVTHILTFPSY